MTSQFRQESPVNKRAIKERDPRKPSPVKLIFHDIDGCLNPPDGEDFGPGDSGGLTHNQNQHLLRLKDKIEESNLHLVLNTGRNLEDSISMVEILSGDHCRYGLFEHGAYGWDFVEDREIDLHAMALEQKDQDRVKKYEDMEVIPDLIAWYRSEGRHILSKQLGLEPPPLRKRSNLSLECIGGLSAPVLMKTLKEVIDQNFANPQQKPLIYCHSAYFVDVLGTVHKSDGAHLLMNHLGLEDHEVLVIGDGMNDMDMFASWPNLLCPANAFGDLKSLCREKGGWVSERSYIEATLSLLETL